MEKTFIRKAPQKNKTKEEDKKEKVEITDGVFVSKKLLMKGSSRTCPVCGVYSFNKQDDVYMSKFQCCFKCYIQYFEGREEKWLKKITS